VRTLTRCDVKRSGRLLTFVIDGDGFLYKMCRGIVGTLVQLGGGKFTEPGLRQMLAARDRRVAGVSARRRDWFCGGCIIENVKRETRNAKRKT